MTALSEYELVGSEDKAKLQNTAVNEGLPVLDIRAKPVSYFEFWPTWFFYIPVVVYWIYLSVKYRNLGLPMTVNPHIPLGGMVGESKVDILKAAGPYADSYILPFIVDDLSGDDSLYKSDEHLRAYVENKIEALVSYQITCPFVVKPELGCRGSGVRVITSPDDLVSYLKEFPKERRFILQKMAPYSAEAGLFYERMPNDSRGAVTSMTLKYQPYVIGDGVKTLKTLILENKRFSILRELYLQKNYKRLYSVPAEGESVVLAFAGSHCRGSIFRNGNAYITEALSEKINKIMLDFPEFHYGRLDVKFKNMESLQRGEEFVIIEVNGVSSEKTHIWDSRTSLREAFATLFEQYSTLFKMGNEMKKVGHKAPSVKLLVSTWLQELKQNKRYPSTD